MRLVRALVVVLGGAVAVAACGTVGESVFVIPELDLDAGGVAETSTFVPPEFEGGGCQPRSCAALGVNCGPVPDGCGGVMDCGSCTSPEVCGGGGRPSVCGKNPCTPKTCLEQGANCGPVADGCGGMIASCGTCTVPDSCGGGGMPSRCGKPGADGGSACTPQTCAAAGANCGPVANGCGGLIASCGTCAPPPTCGGGGTPSVCGGTAGCVPLTCASAGKNCGPVADGCGGLIPSCGTCTAPSICGGGGVANVCGVTLPPCVGLCLKQVKCDGGADTTLSGTVLSPAGNLPIFDALVYVPNSPVAAFAPGVSCDQCSGLVSGTPLVSVKTGYDGKFVLKNMPAGTNIPLVIQLGKWRKQIVVPSVPACANTALTPAQTSLPKNKTEGDIPLTAISTGDLDGLECVLRKIGISDSEFTNPSGTGRIRFYFDNGSKINSSTPSVSTLVTNVVNDTAELSKYDIAIFECVGSEQIKTVAQKQNLQAYANKGGRVYGTHYGYVWFHDYAPWSTTATWVPETDAWPSATAFVDTTFPKGAAFAQWLGQPSVGALAFGGAAPPRVTIVEARHDVDDPLTAPTQGWLRTNAPEKSVQHLTFNTPWGKPANEQCGRVLYSDFHVTPTGKGSGGKYFPAECTTTPLTAQEKILAFMLFDLASCIQVDKPTCTKKTCATLTPPVGCGPAGDGCGGVIDCGPCTPPATCGGGGVPFQCGAPSCVKKTCVGLGVNCGLVGDGCGGSLDCGPCTVPGEICGGGGPSKCGGNPCTPRSCAAQGLECGLAGNGCGAAIDCGVCPPTKQCIGGKCLAPTCLPKTCAILGFDCGPAADGCGGLLSCGVCAKPGDTCGGGGSPNVCGNLLK